MTAMERLASVAPELVAMLVASSPNVRQSAAIAAARLAVERSTLTDPSVTAALKEVGDRALDSTSARAVQIVADELDRQAWAMADDESNRASYLALFSQARAASAVALALDTFAESGWADAIYEAFHATDEPDVIRSVVMRVLAAAP